MEIAVFMVGSITMVIPGVKSEGSAQHLVLQLRAVIARSWLCQERDSADPSAASAS